MKTETTFFMILLTLIITISCSDESNSKNKLPFNIQKSDLTRNLSPEVTESDFSEMLAENKKFALGLYSQLRNNSGNLFYSPHSISLANAMTYAGAGGNTELEMADTLNFTLTQEKLHPAFNKLDLLLTNTGQISDDGRFILSIENSIWCEQTYNFLENFLDTLALNYGAGIHLLDFINKPDDSRLTINAWVENQTNDKIIDLLGPGTVSSYTRLVLTNAIYFFGKWLNQFEEEYTAQESFSLLDGSQISVPMMNQEETHAYTDGDDYQAVKLAYEGGAASMLIIMPDAGNFNIFEQNFDDQALSEITGSLEPANVDLKMPRWEFDFKISLKNTLMNMGMNDAFSTPGADFSSIDGTFDLYIGDVIHQAFVSVDENGTEAAAATAVIMDVDSAPSDTVIMHINRPFIFLIRDSETGTILFAGRVVNPVTE